MTLIPEKKVPSLTVKTVKGERWALHDSKPEQFTLLVFYRGLHCPVCKDYLKQLTSMLGDFDDQGIHVIAISSDSKERAEKAYEEWDLAPLRLGYEFPVPEAKDWGLFVSNQLESSKNKDVPEPEQFIEPGLFLITPEGSLYASSIQNMPFARPSLKEVLKAAKFIEEKDYPARGRAEAA